MKEVKMIGIGSYAPEQIMTNNDLEKIVETSDEWITTRTGIKERRISKGENTSDLATKAALKAMESAGVTADELDLIILATSSPDAMSPATACFVQANIGAVNAVCFDISAGCAGFLFALNTASQFIKTGQSKTALVIGSEVLSKVTDWTDRSTCVLFGDGSGAIILKASDEKGIASAFMGTQGNKAGCLGIHSVPVRNPYSSPEEVNDIKIHMDGREVFRFATSVVVEGIEKVLEDTGNSMDDIKFIVPHQANYRIIEYAAKKLQLDIDKFYMNLQEYGNTSAASIPLALDEMASKGLLKKGDKVILIAFGAGLVWSVVLLEWSI